MDKKANRNYELTYIDGKTGDRFIIKPPFTIDFDVVRNDYSSSNIGSIRVYNLSKENRARIRHDWVEFNLFDRVILKAGYGEQIAEILNMSVSQAWSVRQGTDFITNIQCLDGGFAEVNAIINQSFPAGTPQRDILKAGMKALAPFGVGQGALGVFNGEIPRGNAMSGQLFDALKEVSGSAFFIDNSVVHVLKDGEAIAGDPIVINSQSGLLGTPTREFFYVNFDMIFEPRLAIGKLIRLESVTGDSDINTTYIVHSVAHKGIISEAVAGEAITTVGCRPGNFVQIKPETTP